MLMLLNLLSKIIFFGLPNRANLFFKALIIFITIVVVVFLFFLKK